MAKSVSQLITRLSVEQPRLHLSVKQTQEMCNLTREMQKLGISLVEHKV